MLCVSTAAVSKWEWNQANPGVDLLWIIANLSDRLLWLVSEDIDRLQCTEEEILKAQRRVLEFSDR